MLVDFVLAGLPRPALYLLTEPAFLFSGSQLTSSVFFSFSASSGYNIKGMFRPADVICRVVFFLFLLCFEGSSLAIHSSRNHPASRGFFLAWLLAFVKSFVCVQTPPPSPIGGVCTQATSQSRSWFIYAPKKPPQRAVRGFL